MRAETSPFDRLVGEAWPAPGRVEAGGWVYRHAGGVTKRANSVLPLGTPGDLGRAVDEAEEFYASLGLPCVFSIGPRAPEGLDGELERRGYGLVDPTLVMTVPIPESTGGGAGTRMKDAPDERWLRVWWSVEGGRHPETDGVPARDWAARILTGVSAGYALLPGDRGDAVGRAVPQGEWLGVYCMAVEPPARRTGLGAAVLRALLDWGRERGAARAYLLVTEANAAARALYERAGFAVAGRYHYRVARVRRRRAG
ncbi:GNAT family N-acetyltransferase [Microbispora sp. ATCC PTA-5024]|uniref:GNAT family N-acetyltransferase n=1 Tax=Microbispora sp. ATCC PTA-5024 TaxID=316330 RepID=UPI0004246EEC|nr:GNAT family N-acetyltransferase [Microbispora sp. ATCC PTA-5024]